MNSATANEGTVTLTTASGSTTYSFVTPTHPAPGVKGRMAVSGGGLSGSVALCSVGGGSMATTCSAWSATTRAAGA